jgi:hypothetical protein
LDFGGSNSLGPTRIYRIQQGHTTKREKKQSTKIKKEKMN